MGRLRHAYTTLFQNPRVPTVDGKNTEYVHVRQKQLYIYICMIYMAMDQTWETLLDQRK